MKSCFSNIPTFGDFLGAKCVCNPCNIYIYYYICHYLIFDIGYKTVVASNMHTLDIGGV